MDTTSLWMFGLLLTVLSGAQGLKTFPANFVVATSGDENPVTLTCGPSAELGSLWKFNGDPIDFNSDVHLHQEGADLVVSEVDAPTFGEYSCWTRGQLTSSTFLLEAKEEEEEEDSLLTCRAKSYDCVFSCHWTGNENDLVRLGLGPECSKGEDSCRWVNSSSDLSNGKFQFEMPHSLSAYAEESTKLELTVEAITNLSILRKTMRFYLRDIVQPDSPQIVRCEEEKQNLHVTIDPPPSWSAPHSFFSMEHEIEYMLRDDGKVRRSSSTLIPKRISKLRVRSRDSYVLSNWSLWTPWKNVTH